MKIFLIAFCDPWKGAILEIPGHMAAPIAL